jgi:hypothetical protein
MKLRITFTTILVAPTLISSGQDVKTSTVQPLPYSHKQHLAPAPKCEYCHIEPDPGEMMTFPATEKCMTCHQSVGGDKPTIEDLTAYTKSNEAFPWVRVYKIPEWVAGSTAVDFSHKNHLQAGAKCQTCHGMVAERDSLFKEGDNSMGACMECRRQNDASVQCEYCHDPR